MADYDWFPERREAERKQMIEDGKKRAMGFHPVYVRHGSTLSDKLVYYRCRRGCGTLVWDINDHVKNVCREFNPAIGEGSEP